MGDLTLEPFQGGAGWNLNEGEGNQDCSSWGVLVVYSCPAFLSLWYVLLCCLYECGRGVIDSEDSCGSLIEPMLVETPPGKTDWLSEYIEAHNLNGSSMADCQHDFSAAAICPSGHNYDDSEARFNGGAQYLGEVLDDHNLSAIGLEIYELEEEFSDDEANLFSN